MDTKKFLSLFRENTRIEKTAQALADKQARIHWKGLVGSTVKMIETRQSGTLEEINRHLIKVTFGFMRLKVER